MSAVFSVFFYSTEIRRTRQASLYRAVRELPIGKCLCTPAVAHKKSLLLCSHLPAPFVYNTHQFSLSISFPLTSPYAFQLKKTSQLIYEMCTLLPPSKKFLRNQPYFNYSDSILLFLCIVSYKENYFKK